MFVCFFFLFLFFLLTDEYSREPSSYVPSLEEDDELPIEPISDIGINQINALLFNDVK